MARLTRGQLFDVVVLALGVGAASVLGLPWIAHPHPVTLAAVLVAVSVVILSQFPLEVPTRAGDVVIGFEAAALAYLALATDPAVAVTLWMLASVVAHGLVQRRSWSTRVFNVGCTTICGTMLVELIEVGRGHSDALQLGVVALGCAAYFVADLLLTGFSLAVHEGESAGRVVPVRQVVIPLVAFVGIDSLGYLGWLLDRAYAGWALLLLVVPLLTIVVAARAVRRARDSEQRTAALFDLARAAAEQDSPVDVIALLVQWLTQLMPQRDIRISDAPPTGDEIGEPLPDGSHRPRWLVVGLGRGETGLREADCQTVRTLAGVAAESLERQRLVAEMTRMARFDPLTGLANRAMFGDRLAQASERARRHDGRISVLYCDLDGFKAVNDRFGHHMGDQVLALAAQRLQLTLRAADTAARLGGDEFAVLAEDLANAEEAIAVGNRIVAAFADPIEVKGQHVLLGVSVGVAVSEGEVDAQTLLRSADMAMYRAKAFGKNRVEFFDPQMRSQSEHRVRLEDELRTALAEETLSLELQPIVDLHSRSVDGFEALLRWNHPSLGAVPPEVLLPVAEQLGLIPRLGRWVLRESHRLGVTLAEAAGRPLSIAFNVAGEQLRDEQFLLDVERLLPDKRVQLVLELTERALVEEVTADAALQRLHRGGARIAIDDFGIGYSSIGFLHRSGCIDVVKIDRSFVRTVATDPRACALIESVVAMANSLDAVVVAEGIEDEAGCDIVARLGCRFGQGFLFSAPVSVSEACELARSGRVPSGPAMAPVIPLPRHGGGVPV